MKKIKIIPLTLVLLFSVSAGYIIFRNNVLNINNHQQGINLKREELKVVSYLLSNSEDTGLNHDDVIFYIKNNNIYAYDLKLNEERQLSDYRKNPDYFPYYEDGKQIPSISISNLTYFAKERLGYSKCALIEGDYGCGIYILNIETREITEKRKFDKDLSLADLGFYDENKFAYTYFLKDDFNNFSKYVFELVDNNETKILNSFGFQAFGRGYNQDDFERISFSKDGKNLFQINTNSPKEMFDSKIYLYNLTDNSSTSIGNAIQPAWLSNNEIVYSGYMENKVEYLFKFDLAKNSSVIIVELPRNARQPISLDKRAITYLQDDIKSYDFDDQTVNVLLVSEVNDYKRVNESTYLYNKKVTCGNKENCGGVGGRFEISQLYLLDLDKEFIDSDLTFLETISIDDFATYED